MKVALFGGYLLYLLSATFATADYLILQWPETAGCLSYTVYASTNYGTSWESKATVTSTWLRTDAGSGTTTYWVVVGNRFPPQPMHIKSGAFINQVAGQ